MTNEKILIDLDTQIDGVESYIRDLHDNGADENTIFLMFLCVEGLRRLSDSISEEES